MENNDNAAYYLARAKEEDEAARSAVNPLAARIHSTLASRYRANAADAMSSKNLIAIRD